MNEVDIVKIYQDPITKGKLEGWAKLIRKTDMPDVHVTPSSTLERWEVEFIDDESGTYIRDILTDV